MANQFVTLPAPAGNGSGAAVDTSTFGGLRTITNSGNGFTFEPTVTIEFSNEAVPVNWAPLWIFGKPGEKNVVVAARWMRATVSNYRGGGAPVVDVGGDDSGAQYAQLPVTPGNGLGAAVDVSGMDSFKTVHVGGAFRGAMNIEISEDGGATYSQVATFYGPGHKTLELVAEFMRVRRTAVPQIRPGNPVVWVGAVDGAAGTAGIFVEDEGVLIAPNQFSTLDFVGAGVTATDAGGGVAQISIPGGIDGIDVDDDGVPIGAGPYTKLNFQGPGVVASDAGGGEADVIIPGTTYEDEGVPVAGAPHDTANFTGDGVSVTDAGGGRVNIDISVPGGGGDRTWYGMGVDGDLVTAGGGAGDFEQLRDMYFNDLTISAGDTWRTHGYRLFVAGTLTIAAGGFLDNSATSIAGAPAGTLLGGMFGADSNVDEAPRAGNPGVSSPWWPFTDTGKTGGAGGDTTAAIPFGPRAGGPGGVANLALGSSPLYGVLMSLGDGVTGGAGGGSGATYSQGAQVEGGDGGGGGGVMVICARHIVAPDGAIRCRGADGGPGSAIGPNTGGSGGGGGMGGVILVITDDPAAPVCDVSGGAGGAGGGPFTLAGEDGDDGIVYAISPIWGAL